MTEVGNNGPEIPDFILKWQKEKGKNVIIKNKTIEDKKVEATGGSKGSIRFVGSVLKKVNENGIEYSKVDLK